MAKLYKCMLRPVPLGAGDSPRKVRDVVELVTDMGLLIQHSDGCFTINPEAGASTHLVRRASSRTFAPEPDVKKDQAKIKRKVKKAKKSIRPWTVTVSRTSPSQYRTGPSQYRRYRRPRRAHRRAARISRTSTRGAAKRRQRKPLHKKPKPRSSVHKKKTLRKFYRVMRRLTDSLTDMSKKIKKII